MAGAGADPAGPVLARLPRPRASPRCRLAVVADPHLAVGDAGTWKVLHRTRERLSTAVGDANARDVDALVVAGDLTRDGTAAEFDAVERVLADLGVPWAAIPGNHDVPKEFNSHEGIEVESFTERFAPGLPFAMEVGPLTVLGVDTATAPDGRLRETWGGALGGEGRDRLEVALARAERPVVVAHHNLAPLPENPGGKWARFPMRDAGAVRDLLCEHDVPLAVTAHHHVPAARRHGPTAEVLAPAVCSFPQASLVLEVGPGGTTVRLVPLADESGVREARRHALCGKPLGRGILTLVESRLAGLDGRPEL